MKTKEKMLFGKKKSVIGMIHVGALPGAPKYNGDMKRLISTAVSEAEIYASGGVDALMIENMHDVPYLNRSAGPEITAAMSVIGFEVKNKSRLPTGIQILAGANKQALAAAKAAGLDFVRAEGFVFAHVADEGIISSDAGELMRYRKQISAENVLIFTDIKKKHSSHQITEDMNIAETAKAAEFFLSDGVIVTGKSTSESADINEVAVVSNAVNIPVLVGSGITADNLPRYFSSTDGFIVGSHFKKDGNWFNGVERRRVENFMRKFLLLNQ